jgi:hypothetical protein
MDFNLSFFLENQDPGILNSKTQILIYFHRKTGKTNFTSLNN